MRTLRQWALIAVVAGFGAAGCKALDVQNPNAPDAATAFSDPGAVAGLVTGAMRNWVQWRQSYGPGLTLNAMADAYSSSWNNYNLRYYSSYGTGGGADANGGGDCAYRCGWANTTSHPARFEVEGLWYGYYSILSSVNDVLVAIRVNNLVLGTPGSTAMHEAAAVMLQGVVFAEIALNYDQGFIVDEATDISDPASLPLVTREEMRDAAIEKLDAAIALMTASPFAATPSGWLGVPGPTYSSAQLIRLIRTMQASLLAYFPRDAAEDAAVDWAQVATYASQGMSTGTPFDFSFNSDRVNLIDGVKDWGNGTVNMKIDTRLAHIITDGPNPALIHNTPWPGDPDPQPDAFDARVGDGSWGPEDDFQGAGTIAETADAGSDFAYSGATYLNPARGLSHFGNMSHIRYSYAAYPGYGLPDEDGTGVVPTYTATMNDLLWAEGLIRSAGNLGTAATLINKTRVTRGGLTPAAAGDGVAALRRAVEYENEVELLGLGVTPFYNRRRGTPANWGLGSVNEACPAILCMWPDTPRHMPIPAKELSVLQKELYTFGGGGAGVPDYSVGQGSSTLVMSARKIGDALIKENLRNARRRPSRF